MDPIALKPWLDLLVSPGVPVIITGLVLWLGVKYIPRLIEALIAFIAESPKHLQVIGTNLIEIASCLRDVRRYLRYLLGDVDQCKSGAQHLANVIEVTLRLPSLSKVVPDNSPIFSEVERMQKSLADRPHDGQGDFDREQDRERKRRTVDESL